MPISSLPFDFDKHFVPDTSSPDCLGACFASCARYWKDLRPDLKLATTLEYWNKFLEKANTVSPKGISTLKLMANLGKPGEDEQLFQETDDEQSETHYIVEVIEKKKTLLPLSIRTLTLNFIHDASVELIMQIMFLQFFIIIALIAVICRK